jgi:UDP-glucose 4-epimerase
VKHCLVTGGAGFIGAAVAQRLIERGDRVTVVDDLSTGARENVPAGADFVLADLRSAPPWMRWMDAASTPFFTSGASPLARSRTPIRSPTSTRMHAAPSCSCAGPSASQSRRFLFASSMAVYGSTEGPVAEACPPQPVSFYGASKVAAEAEVSLFGRHGGAPTILRMFNVYGPGQNLGNLRQGWRASTSPICCAASRLS